MTEDHPVYEQHPVLHQAGEQSTTAAAKLLPCPWCVSEPKIIGNDRSFNLACDNDDCPVQPMIGTYKREDLSRAITEWNTRPQPAPPEGEPELPFDQIAENLAYGGPRIPNSGGKADTDWIKTRIAEELKNVYRLGLAARPKVEDAEVKAHCEYLRARNNPALHQAADLLERLAGASKHYLACLQLETDKRIGIESVLAEREAELVKADAVVNAMTGSDFYTYGGRGERQRDLTEWYEQSVARHADRQQQNALAEPEQSRQRAAREGEAE